MFPSTTHGGKTVEDNNRFTDGQLMEGHYVEATRYEVEKILHMLTFDNVLQTNSSNNLKSFIKSNNCSIFAQEWHNAIFLPNVC